INAGINYNSVRYTLQKEQNNSYYTHNYSADITYTFLEDFSLSTDIDYTGYSGRTGDFNQKFTRWNASIAKQLFKNKRGEIRLSVMDILNQNTNTSRNVADNYIEDVQNTALKRFGLLTFTWNLNNLDRGRDIPVHEMYKGTGDIKIRH
ncbi:MAG TPA: outer membrane beta-barrel protein, partial [Segetibacter sp.]|nr:outer membrane beta-barrel protein [Segetibacter sp.]